MTADTVKLNSFIFLMACCLPLGGCSPLRLLNMITPESGFKRTENIPYGGEHRQALDIYVPVAQPGKAPVVIFLYGGGWSSGSKNLYMYVGEAITALGFIAVIPDYRRFPEIRFPVFVEDGATALAWVQKNISHYNGDPENIVLMGHSAGAHIAAMLSLDESYLKAVDAKPARGMIGLAGPYNFLPMLSEYLGDIFGPPERYPLSQPVNFVDGDEAPILLLHGARDTRVSPLSSEDLMATIMGKGGCAKTVIYPELDHATITWAMSAPYRKQEVMEEIRNFVRNSLECPGS